MPNEKNEKFVRRIVTEEWIEPADPNGGLSGTDEGYDEDDDDQDDDD